MDFRIPVNKTEEWFTNIAHRDLTETFNGLLSEREPLESFTLDSFLEDKTMLAIAGNLIAAWKSEQARIAKSPSVDGDVSFEQFAIKVLKLDIRTANPLRRSTSTTSNLIDDLHNDVTRKIIGGLKLILQYRNGEAL